MLLTEILNNVEAIQVIGNPELIDVTGISNSSRDISKGNIFVAIKGFKTDGHQFISEAISKGASVVVLENNSAVPDELLMHSGIVKILVRNSRIALSQISNVYYGKPSGKLKVIGITGTKGKTTTSFLIKHLIEKAGFKVGLIGTIANYIGQEKIDTKLTTPESHQIHELMKKMVDAGCAYCVMEVSSHSLELHRVHNISFDYAIFTNLTSDHFDFHQTFEGYLLAKKILFDSLSPKASIIVNIDDKSWPQLIRDSAAHAFYFGINPAATFQMRNITYSVEGTTFELRASGMDYQISAPLIGEFNAYNIAAAISVCSKCGFEINDLVENVKSIPQIPGRFEVITQNDKKVIIDYSHTTDSLRQALSAIRTLVKDNRKIYTVFGCGGDRDKTKRPEMGKVVDQLSDEFIITSDNPRTEDPYSIIEDIKKGISRESYKIIENREEAIKSAIIESEPDAVILIAGKGHEDYQEIDGVRHHFSDKEKTEEFLKLC